MPTRETPPAPPAGVVPPAGLTAQALGNSPASPNATDNEREAWGEFEKVAGTGSTNAIIQAVVDDIEAPDWLKKALAALKDMPNSNPEWKALLAAYVQFIASRDYPKDEDMVKGSRSCLAHMLTTFIAARAEAEQGPPQRGGYMDNPRSR